MTMKQGMLQCSLCGILLAVCLSKPLPAQGQQRSKYVCAEPQPASMCNAENTCGSASSACEVDIKKSDNGASSTPLMTNAKTNKPFCAVAGTTITWKSTSKDTGFVIDFGPTSPFESSGAIIGGSDRSVSAVAKQAGCFKYSTGACVSGAIYGMCGSAENELVVINNNK